MGVEYRSGTTTLLQHRVASTVHAVVVTVINVAMLAKQVEVVSSYRASTNTKLNPQAPTPVTNLSLGFSLGYFVRDLAVSLWHYPKVCTYNGTITHTPHQLGGVPMVLHHMAAILSCWRTLYMQEFQLQVMAFLATEATTPLINLRYWLLKAGAGGSLAYRINALCILACAL